MKKTHLFLFILTSFFIMASCSDDDSEDNYLWDFVNYSIKFSPQDHEILSNKESLGKIKVTYNGREFFYSKEESDAYQMRASYVFPLALRCNNYSSNINSPNYILSFGEFSPTSDYKNQKFTIDWGNGRVDKVEFSIYTTWKKGEPTVHKQLKFNDEERDFDTIVL